MPQLRPTEAAPCSLPPLRILSRSRYGGNERRRVNLLRIGVDLMGSEQNPQEYYPAVKQMAEQLPPSDTLVVFATEEVISALPSSPKIKSQLVKEVITNDDDPLAAVRHKRQSSMVVGVEKVHAKEIDAFVSPGNTGALIAACSMTLPMFSGIKRPPLLASLPKKGGPLAVVDVGGLVSCNAEQMVPFAWMGAAFQRVMHNVEKPAVGLLNIGTETRKGTAEIRKAYHLLNEGCEKHNCRVLGNVEAKEVFQNQMDVLVTDGFTGNVFLKTTEGLSAYMLDDLYHRLEKESTDAMRAQIEQWRQQFNHANYPGALICGVDGLIIKCHGASTTQGMLSSLKAAVHLMHFDIVNKLKQSLI
jgi:phosphate acyltransferase